MGLRKWGLFLLILSSGMISLPGLSKACTTSDDLTGWHYKGDVKAVDDGKRLGDSGASWSYLYQFVFQERGSYKISFDFKNELSPEPYTVDSGDFSFVDSFYASLYFVNSCSRFKLETCAFDYVLPLFDMDHGGPFNNHGVISESEQDEGWRHFEMTFENHFHKIVPTFELFDLNYIDDDSDVTIANVSISQVPVPGTLILMGSGLVCLAGFGRRKKQRPVR